jgi:two-component system sensor histidine kinase UhpB
VEPLGTEHSKPLSGERDLELRLRCDAINETQELAAELHDGLGQELAGISLLVSALRRDPQAQHPDIQEPLGNLSDLVVRAMVSCRRVSEGFGGFLVRQHGLTAALLHFASQFADEGIHIEFLGRDMPALSLDESTASRLFAIAREAIFNAFRHSRAKTIHVTCDHVEDTIHLIVEDDGIGLMANTSREHGIGRSIMEFRASSIGAKLTFTSVPTGGLRVECSLSMASDDD